MDLAHCPTCGQDLDEPLPVAPCGELWPPSAADVVAIRCQLPTRHRSEDHWHASIWPGTPAIAWA